MNWHNNNRVPRDGNQVLIQTKQKIYAIIYWYEGRATVYHSNRDDTDYVRRWVILSHIIRWIRCSEIE